MKDKATHIRKAHKTLKVLIATVRDTKPIENLKEILGKPLGSSLYDLINMAEKADKELDILHACLTELYEKDCNVQQIRACLDKIDRLKETKP